MTSLSLCRLKKESYTVWDKFCMYANCIILKVHIFSNFRKFSDLLPLPKFYYRNAIIYNFIRRIILTY